MDLIFFCVCVRMENLWFEFKMPVDACSAEQNAAFSFNDISLQALFFALSALCTRMLAVCTARGRGCHAAFRSCWDSLHLHKAAWKANSLCQSRLEEVLYFKAGIIAGAFHSLCTDCIDYCCYIYFCYLFFTAASQIFVFRLKRTASGGDLLRSLSCSPLHYIMFSLKA